VKTETSTLEYWVMKNGRAICIQERENVSFVAFGYLDGLRKTGFRYLGSYETLVLAVETTGAFLSSVDGLTFRHFRTCIAGGRFGPSMGRRN
jgi:hypothetical protein